MSKIIVIVKLTILVLLISFAVVFAAEELKIMSVKPRGELKGIEDANEITVTFNSAITELQQIGEIKVGWFKIEPAVDGEFQWLGTNTLAFKPRQQLTYATEYVVTIKTSVTALNGAKLPRANFWKFQTPTPFVQYTYPRNKETSVDTKVIININFNIPVLPADLSNYLDLSVYDDKKNEVKLQYIINEGSLDAAQYLSIKPVNDLQKDTMYYLRVRQGMPAAEGNLGSKVDWISTFRTYAKFNFINLNNGSTEPVNPTEAVRLLFTNPVEYSELISKLKFEPLITFDDYSHSYRQNTMNIYGPFLPDTTYHLTIARGLTDIFGNKIERPIELSFQTRSYDPKYTIPVGESVLESYGDLNFPLELINLAGMEAKIKVVPDDSLDIIGTWFCRQSFYSQTDRLRGRYDFKENITPRIKKNKMRLFPFNVKKYLPQGKSGVLLIQFYGDEADRNDYKLMLMQVTHLGITAKFSPVTNAIYVTHLKDGLPVSNVPIEIRDGSGKVYWNGRTDEKGYCESPGWQRLGIPVKKDREPIQWAIARAADEIAFTHSERGTGISPWEFEIPYEWQPRDEQIDGAIFTDRGIYRTDDTVHVKVVLREKYGLEWRVTAQNSFQVIIEDPTGTKVYEQTHSLNEFNSFDFEMEIPYDAKRGYYSIRVVIPQKLRWEETIYESFWVEDYQPAEFEVTVRPQKMEYIFGDTLSASISSAYLFGAVMKNAPLRWSISRSHYFHTPPGWDGYYFNPIEFHYGQDRQVSAIGTFSSYSYTQQDTLDENGNINIKYFLEEPALFSSARYVIEGEVSDQNQRRIAGSKEVIVYRGEYHIGIKPKSFFGEQGKPYPIFFIATRSTGEVIPERQVNIQIIRRNWYSVRRAGTGGRYSWQSEVIDSTVVETGIQTDARPSTYNFMPKKSGYYLIRASSVDPRGNKIVADCSFYILGKDYVAWSRSDDDRIELEKNKNSYKPGDVATIMIKSPFERATALVTIEREGIIDHFVQEAIGSTPTLEIPIRDIYLPNAYVSVMLIQGRTGDNVFSERGDDIAKPAFKLGYINLPVETGKKRLSVELLTDKKVYKPGETVTVNIKAHDWQRQGERSEVVLAVVDKGVLNLRGYRFTDLHEYFYRSRPLFVTTSESRLNIIGQRNYGEKGEDRGGSGGLMAMFQMRKDFKSTAYWNPSIITNDQGEATVKFRLPDNLTTFVVMAAVHDRSSEFGNGECEFRVSQTLVLKPSLPRFLRYNDLFRAGVVVHNYSDQAGTVSLDVNAKGVQLLDHSNMTSIKLTANESREILFQFKANQVGRAEFTFSGVMGSERDAVQKAIKVEQPLSFEVVALANNSTDDAAEKLVVPQNCYQEMSKLEVKVAATQLVGLTDGVRYLFDYPYGCLEQKISSILPMILFEDVLTGFQLPALKDGDYRQVVQRFLDQIGDFQTPTGGFTYWSGSDYPHPYVSAWTVFAMIKAKDAGYKVNKEILKKSMQYLNSVLREQVSRDLYPYTWNVWAVTNCLILYDLALEKNADHGYIEKLYQSRERVPLFGLAYLLKAMKYAKSNDTMYRTVRQILLNGIKEAPTSAHFEEPIETGLQWCFHSNVRTTAHILQSLLELNEELPQAPKIVKWLMLKRNLQGAWRNTQENIYVLHAFNTYFKIYEKEKPDFQLEIKLANNKIMEVLYREYSLEQKVSQFDLSPFRPGKELSLEFDKQGAGRYYYETRLTYYPRDPLPARDQGISIVKKWEVVEGKQMADNSIAVGSVIKVTLTVASSMERNYVVIDDPLPAGFEVINTRLKTVSESYHIYQPLQLDDSYWGGFNFYELRDNKVLVFADNLSTGVHSFVYLCQALTTGDFSMPPTKVEEMYTPEVFGRTNANEIIIR